jgi:hypothetical protein
MLAARFDFSVGLKVPVPFNRYFKDKKKLEFKPVLFVGGSMITKLPFSRREHKHTFVALEAYNGNAHCIS